MADARKLLVLLDLNGTLLYRATKLLPAAAPAFDQLVGERRMFYYMRPHARELVAYLVTHPLAVPAFYTSMRAENALNAVNWLLDGAHLKGPRFESTALLYDRSYTQPDTEADVHWKTRRDLDAVWSCGDKVGKGFDASNTVVVDDTMSKMRHLSANVLLVPEFTEQSVRGSEDDELKDVKEALELLLNSAQDHSTDVRSFLLARQLHTQRGERVATGAGHTHHTSSAAAGREEKHKQQAGNRSPLKSNGSLVGASR